MERRVSHGGGIVLGLMASAPFWVAVALVSCAWKPVVHTYPSGLKIIRGDQAFVSEACGDGLTDQGARRDMSKTVGCYFRDTDTIYIRNTNEGAKALLHELAHREGVADPRAGGFDW